MEAQLSLVIIPVFLFFGLHLLVKYYKQKTKQAHKWPPGPKKLPLIGNLHQIAGKLPHRIFRELAYKYGPLMHIQLGEISAVVVSSPKLAKEIFKTHDICFAARPQLLSAKIIGYNSTDIVFAPYGDYWRQMRKICMLELLSAKRVQSFSYIREDETRKFIQSIKSSAGSPINLTNRIFSLSSSNVSRAALGEKSKDHDEFVSCVHKTVALTGGLDIPDLFPSIKPLHVLSGVKQKLMKIHKKADRILENIVSEHQEKRERLAKEGKTIEDEQEDLVDVLLRVQQSGDLEIEITNSNIKAVIWNVFVGGTDTPAVVLEWAMSELMKNPRVREKAQAEIREAFKGKKIISENDLEDLTYLKLVIKETLRLHPPSALFVPRECIQSTNIEGYEIPVKTKVLINAWAIGRDPNYWNDADSFTPERFDGSSIDFRGNNFEYIPFGAGRRMCPGISFGLAGVLLPLALLLYHFNWELPNMMTSEDLDMDEHYGMTIGREHELCLVPTIYMMSD